MKEQYVGGLHAVKATLKNLQREILKLIICHERQDKRLQEIANLAKNRQVKIEKLDSATMNQRFPGLVHQGVVLETKSMINFQEADLSLLIQQSKKPCLILILDGITDPHNLGACLRTADACGVDFMIIPKDKNADLTAVVSKVACGAMESLPIVKVTNLARTLQFLQKEGIWIYGAAGEASDTLYTMDFRGPLAIVMGSEGEGLRRLTRENCDGLFAIPMLGSVESLNVSVATGICLYEVIRQRARPL